jgi:DNA-binding MarR family transcriptional regulator
MYDSDDFPVPPGWTRPWRSVTANAYVSYHAIRRTLRRDLDWHGHDSLAAVLLRLLWSHYGRSDQSAITRELGLPASTISGAMARLERRELIRRYPAYDDRRVKIVELTTSGRTAAGIVGTATLAIEARANSAVGRVGRDGFNAMANTLAAVQAEHDLNWD